MADMLSAGVELTEQDFSTYVSSVSSAVVGIVGAARKGNFEPTLITSQDQFIKTFGKPVTTDYGAYAALTVLTQCDQVWYQRVMHSGTKATAGVDTTDKVTFTAIGNGITYNGIQVETTSPAIASPNEFTVTVKSATGSVLETYTDVNLDSTDASYILTLINGHSAYIHATISTESGATVTAKTFTLAGGIDGGAYASAGTSGTDKLVFTSRTFDTTLNGTTIAISDEDPITNTFDVTLSSQGIALEVLESLSLDVDDERYVETFVNTYSEHLNVVYSASATGTLYNTSLTMSGGLDGSAGIDKDDIIGSGASGLQGFSNSEVVDVNLLLIPGWADNDVVQAATKICNDRGDCLLILDTPQGLTPQQANDWANGAGTYAGSHTAIDSSYAAVYYPWVKVYDTYTKTQKWLPPSGHVAAQIAYSDSVGEPWFAPAGLTRGKLNQLVELEYSLTKGDRDALYGKRNIINPLVNFKGQGVVVWGQKTAQRKPSATDRVNVRRLMNLLKKVVAVSTQYFVFEPNDTFTHDKWSDMIEPKLQSIQSQRGVYEFKLVMDSTTVSEDDMNNHRMPGQILIKPTRTAEFIPLSFRIMPNSTVFYE